MYKELLVCYVCDHVSSCLFRWLDQKHKRHGCAALQFFLLLTNFLTMSFTIKGCAQLANCRPWINYFATVRHFSTMLESISVNLIPCWSKHFVMLEPTSIVIFLVAYSDFSLYLLFIWKTWWCNLFRDCRQILILCIKCFIYIFYLYKTHKYENKFFDSRNSLKDTQVYIRTYTWERIMFLVCIC